jgi:hypothetical protein
MPRYSPIPDVPAIAVDPSLEAEPHPGAIPIDVVGAALQTVQQAEQGLQQPLQDPAPEGEDRPRPPKKKRAPRRDGQKHRESCGMSCSRLVVTMKNSGLES